MDIHRCRFIQYPASAINAIAFSHSSLPPVSGGKKSQQKHVQVRLAIGRANGDIEIWNPLSGTWHQELVMPGGRDRSVDGLVWVTDPDEEMADGKIIHGRSRLFSIGYTTTITEWDLEMARAKTHASGQHGDIWCLGVQPLPARETGANPATASRKLVAGTVDGNLVLYSIEDGELRFFKSLIRTPSKKTKMVSLCFQSRNVVIVGCSDSTICAYDIRNGALLRQMTLGSDFSGGSKNIIVWSVKCLPNGDIVSGDSTGQVCIWDGKTYTQAQRIQSHKQDVLCLTVSSDGSKIISGGMDRRTTLYEPIAGQAGRWSTVFHRKYHKHDVKAMASFEGKKMSVVVSGGPDASPVVFPLRAAGKEYHRTLSHLPQSTNLQSAPKARFVVTWWGNEIRIWHLPIGARELLDDAEKRQNRKLLAMIMVKGESNITSAAISEDGTLLVASTASEMKAFQLEPFAGLPSEQLKVTKLQMPTATIGQGGIKVEISPDRIWVSWVEEGSKVMLAKVTITPTGAYTISQPSKVRRLRRPVPKHILLGGLGSYDRNVTQLAFSPDSKMMAAADLAGYIDTWVLRAPGEQRNGASGERGDDADLLSGSGSSSDSSDDEEDQQQQNGESERWVVNSKAALIPKLASAPVVLSFSKASGPGFDGDYTLLAITTLKQVLLFNPLQGTLSDWSRRNTYAKLPEALRETRDLVKGVVWQGPRAWIYGVSFVFMLDLSQDLTAETTALTKSGGKNGIKRKRDESGAGGKMDKQQMLAPQHIKTAVGPDGVEWVDTEMADADGDDAKSVGASSAFEDDDEDDDETDGGELQHMRDGQQQANGDGEAAAAGGKGGVQRRARWWHTRQYRPILGIVPVGSSSKNEGGTDATTADDNGVVYPPLEVALVERPEWEMDQPARYFANGEWER
ncbi:quinon protein alcohol dehydrogenase-like superfamily [Bombardia bombarda]|uniref:Quinon protein alcohol dehydrogenase-like superfamily n=1 Tax=Bombardia bombarda TaxID=252184 RepID=A0AA39XB65_9PEZI|nr:quinon protein alcohol dehydrogenase-like superfamily [Bombardia bombarda]